MIIKNLKKNYSSFQIDIPHLELPDQGVSALVGASGSGKTSFLRILSGLEPCSSLEWIFNNQNINQLPIADRKIAFVFQNLELFPHMTAYENIKFAGLSSKSSRWKEEALFLLKNLNIDYCKNHRADQLSRGEAQRVALVRSLVIQPRILFLDEPFSSLDEEHRKKALNLVKDIIKHYKIPAILVSHLKEDVEFLAQKIVHIKNGRIVSSKF